MENPATGAVLAQVADADPADAVAALDAAVAAQPGWASTAPRERSEILRRAFELVTSRVEQFARLITLEMGKPLAEARGEVAYGAEFLRWFSEEAVRIDGRYAVAPDGRSRITVGRRPVGPCLFITPWNFPLAMATRKVAPAVAAGCTSVLKPANLTPLTAALFAETLTEAGLPPGVLNIVQTKNPRATIEPLLADPRLRKLSFTGSTDVGRQLLRASAGTVLRTSMELGGNAPFLVFEDADLDEAVEGAMVAKLRNAGQACTAANRFLIAESVADEFSRRLSDRMVQEVVGDGMDPATTIGPLIDGRSRDKVRALVDQALDHGARILTGIPSASSGYYVEPTVLVSVDRDAEILKNEVFGPIASITTFTDEDDAIALANATEYGLAAYAFTRSISRAQRLGEQLQTGMLGINTGLVSNAAAPFGGVKQSGLGREGGREGIEEYLDIYYVAHPDPYVKPLRPNKSYEMQNRTDRTSV